MAAPIGTRTIEGMDFTLFYDYDQLRDRKLTNLSPNGRIEWFQLRMQMVFLEPLKKIFDRNSPTHKELNSSPESEWPWTAMMTAAFSILLNGVEALGSFLPYSKKIVHEYNGHRRNNYFRFREFIQTYMPGWDVKIQGTCYQSSYLPEILWDHFRNGIAHAFVVAGGGIEYEADVQRWLIKWNGYLEIGPCKFFNEFSGAVDNFFKDIQLKHRNSFLARFKDTYPC